MTPARNFSPVTTQWLILIAGNIDTSDNLSFTAGVNNTVYETIASISACLHLQGNINLKNHKMSVNSNPAASQINIKKCISYKYSHISPLSLTPAINPYFRISLQIFVNIREGLCWILRGLEKTGLLKNLKSKISCQGPFKCTFFFGGGDFLIFLHNFKNVHGTQWYIHAHR